MKDRITFETTNPTHVEINGVSLTFTNTAAVVKEVEVMDFDVLADLWDAGGPHNLRDISESAWLSAAFFRLCRAGAITMDTFHTKGVVQLNANCREQSTIASNSVPA